MRKLIVICSLALLALTGFISMPKSASGQANTPTNLEAKLKTFQDNGHEFTIHFVVPVRSDQPVWDIPDTGWDKDGIEIARRTLTEVGDDYFCIEESGVGIIDNYCIPFSNVAYIEYLPGDVEYNHHSGLLDVH